MLTATATGIGYFQRPDTFRLPKEIEITRLYPDFSLIVVSNSFYLLSEHFLLIVGGTIVFSPCREGMTRIPSIRFGA